MYGFKLPTTKIDVRILDKVVTIHTQTFHAYESIYLEDFRKLYGMYPYLSDNSDPIYRD